MGGAFVAVADDATATWWNPAGIATGAYFSMVVERGETTQPANPTVDRPSWRNTDSNFAVVFPALGLSYYRLQISEARPGSSAAAGGQAGGSEIRSISAKQFGVTIGQTIVRGFVVGATLKLLRGGVVNGTSAAAHPLDDADALDVPGETHGDIDLGAMFSTGKLRIGGTLKHASQPTFGSGESAFVVERQGRVGLALIGGGRGPIDAVTLDVDADLTKTHTATGRAQYIAGGLEAWFARRRLGIRGGLSRNIVEPTGTAKSTGLSVALRPSVYLDGALTFGNDTARDGWDIGLRVTF